MTAPRDDKRKTFPLGWFPVILVFIGVFVVSLLLADGVNYLERLYHAPWSLGSGNTLTGTWAGTVTARVGGPRRMVLSLDLEYGTSRKRQGFFTQQVLTHRHGEAYLTGELLLCPGPGAAGGDGDRYQVRGYANRSGSEIDLYFTPLGTPNGIMLDHIAASWQGEALPVSVEYSVPWGSVPHPPFTSSSVHDGIAWTRPNPLVTTELAKTHEPARC